MRIPISFLLLAFLLAGCTESSPEWIYVPDDGYRCEVRIILPPRAKVGERIVLQAERRSGPWKRVRGEEAPHAFPWAKQPPGLESGFEVTASVEWIVLPAGVARFDHDDSHTRTVTFASPGHFKVKALSATPTKAESNEVDIVVE